jgi:integrase
VRPLTIGRKRGELLFTNRNGDQVKHQPFYREHWVPQTRKDGTRAGSTANLADPRPRIHDLRHTHVALLVAAGVSLPVIQARLGHEQIATTIDTYGHLLPDLQIAAADAASRALGSPRAELS